MDRLAPLRGYLTGLLLSGERKSVEPMAAKLDPTHVRARHQSLHHFVAVSSWDERAMLAVARDYALEQLERHGPVEAWVVDDTGMPNKGTHSVGVARQYCGPLGKQDNCQVVVTLSLCNSLRVPSAYRLYLPESWAENAARRRAAGIPRQVHIHSKWEIALGQVDALLTEQLPLAPVVADAGYGDVTAFREALTERGLSYAVGIASSTSVWTPSQQPLSPKPYSGMGRPPKRLRRHPGHEPVSVKDLALRLPAKQWQNVHWREGTKGTMHSRFARLRVRAAHRDYGRSEPRAVEWLLVEWPKGEKEPTKYWLSTVPEATAMEELIYLVKIRWRIERDYQELKDELGLDHYEGRGWRGFHHHGVLCIAAYAFLAAERARLPPRHLLPSCAPLQYPRISRCGVLPLRPERHNPASITTQRIRQARMLLLRLPCCPWCGGVPGTGKA
ncbi:Mobile element protein [Hyalangium minutum]|uniref:Mobile element protein n=1 Tax=Hyalangium minutum TaxID=394096 RepID=A0A085WX17_9BACT|nr:Mobile element protein [Hyalangium minutum]